MNDCDLLIDLEVEGKETPLEPVYSKDSNWLLEAEFPYMDAESSDRLLRAFYVPFLSEKYCKFSKYVILKNAKDAK